MCQVFSSTCWTSTLSLSLSKVSNPVSRSGTVNREASRVSLFRSNLSLPSGPRFAPPSSLRCLWYVFLQQCAYLCHMYGVQAECLEGIFFSFNHRCCVHVYVGELVADYVHQASKTDTGGAPVPVWALCLLARTLLPSSVASEVLRRGQVLVTVKAHVCPLRWHRATGINSTWWRVLRNIPFLFWHWNRHCWRSTPHHCQIWFMRGNGGVPFTSALHGKYKSQNKSAPCRFTESESSQRQSAGTVRPQVLRACSA